MEYPKPQINVDGQHHDILSIDEYKARINMPGLPAPTIRYKMNVSKELDFTTIGDTQFIIFNDRAQNLNLAKRRPRK